MTISFLGWIPTAPREKIVLPVHCNAHCLVLSTDLGRQVLLLNIQINHSNCVQNFCIVNPFKNFESEFLWFDGLI